MVRRTRKGKTFYGCSAYPACDFAVWDEPFYAAYLEATGLDHPMRAEVLGAHERDPEAVARRCAGPVPGGKPHAVGKLEAHAVDRGGFGELPDEGCEHFE